MITITGFIAESMTVHTVHVGQTVSWPPDGTHLSEHPEALPFHMVDD